MNADLTKLVEIFLVPSSILVGALGVASTEPLKTGISMLGLVVSILWAICSHDVFRTIPNHQSGNQCWFGCRRCSSLAG
jgi:hypothetical protein